MKQKALRFMRGALTAMLALIGLSCQEATEPTDVTGDMVTTIEVRDGAQKAVPGASVRWALSLKGQPLTAFKPMGEQGNGVFQETIPVPLAVDSGVVVFEVDPPATAEFANASRIVDSVKICLDTTLVYRFNRQVNVNCGASFNETFDLYCDLTRETTVTGCTPDYVNSAGAPLNLTLASTPALPANARTELFIDGNPVPMNTPVPPGSKFMTCFTFTFPANSQSSRNSYDVTLSGTANGQPCFTSDIELNVEAVAAQPCDCPPANVTLDYPSATTEDTVCVNSVQNRISIPIGPIRNTNESCNLVFRLVPTPGDPEFSVVSLDGGSATERTIPPGGSINSIEVRFAPKSRQVYTREIAYTIHKQNPDGSVTDCPTGLRVVYHGRGGEGVCNVVRTPANDSTLVTVDSTFEQCVDRDDPSRAKRYCVINTGECDLNVTAAITANPDVWEVSPSSLTVEPGERACFEIRFKPRSVDYWPPNGNRTNPVRSRFTGQLSITGLPSCSPSTISLTGDALFPCLNFNDNCYKQWGSKGGEYKVGVDLLPEGSLVSQPSDAKEALAIYVESFNNNAAPTSVTLASGSPSGGSPYVLFRKIDNISLTQNENICQRVGDYQSQCDGNGTGTISGVQEGDVLLLSIGGDGARFCAVMWIRAIRLDRTNDPVNAVPEICFEICYPI